MVKDNEGIKTIKLGVYFWTSISEKNLELPKKTCWDSGWVHATANNRHGIRSGISKNFNNVDEIPHAIKDVLKRSGVTVIKDTESKNYKDGLRKIEKAKLF